jgi:hypothetical protein
MRLLTGLFIMGLLTNCATKRPISDDDIVVYQGMTMGRWGDLSFEQKMQLQRMQQQDYESAMRSLQTASDEMQSLGNSWKNTNNRK